VRLLLVRHGATANNLEARFTGQLDIPLSPLGVRQAERVAEALAGEPLDAIVSSDLARALETAAAIARGRDLRPIADADLRETAMGIWEGMTATEAAAYDAEALALWRADAVHHPPPGGETLDAVLARLLRALARSRERAPDGCVLWVTHGGVIGVLVSHLLGIDLARRGQLRRDNAAITELEIAGEQVVLLRFNETTHLRGLKAEGERSQIL